MKICNDRFLNIINENSNNKEIVMLKLVDPLILMAVKFSSFLLLIILYWLEAICNAMQWMFCRIARLESTPTVKKIQIIYSS